MLELFTQIEFKLKNIEDKLEKKITAVNSSVNQQLDLLNLKYDIAKLEQKYANELNEQRDELLYEITSNMKLELANINKIVALKDAEKLESSLGRLYKTHLKFIAKKINPNEIWIQKLIIKEFKFERTFSALNLVKYKNILGLQNYIKMNNDSFDDVNLNDSLIEAVRDSNLETIMLLVEAGADVNAKDEWNSTALMFASEKGYELLAKYLVNNDADVDAANKYNNTALICAALNGHLEIVKCFVENGADVNLKGGYHNNTALIFAIVNGHLEVVKYLVGNGADLNAEDKNNLTALMLASEKGHIEIVKCLVENGADVNRKNKWNDAALNFSSQKGHFEIVKYLVEKGADVNAKDNYNKTALILASEKGRIEIVKYLVENGADAKGKNNE